VFIRKETWKTEARNPLLSKPCISYNQFTRGLKQTFPYYTQAGLPT